MSTDFSKMDDEEVDFIYTEYGLAKDEELTGDALRLKHDILKYRDKALKI